MDETADAIVIGAGPAGCSAAILLARRGHRVVLVDRAQEPHPKLCTHAIMPAGLPVLQETGVLAEIEAAGAQRWYGVRLWLNGVAFDEALPHNRVAFPYGLSLRRELLDPIMLGAARRERGIVLMPGCEATRLLHDGAHVTGVEVGSSHGRDALRARFVLLAIGRHSRLSRGAGLRTYAMASRHTAYVAYVDGVPAQDRPALEGYYCDGRSASLLPADHGLRVAGVLAPTGSWPAGETRQRLLVELRRFGPLHERLRDARVVSRPVPVRGLVNSWRSPRLRGLLLLGDAGLQSDPLFGQGISWAVRSAAWAAEAVDEAIRHCYDSDPLRRYDQRRAWTFGLRLAAMSTLSAVPPGSMLERLTVANAATNPASTGLCLRLALGLTTVSRSGKPHRTAATLVREAMRGRGSPTRPKRG